MKRRVRKQRAAVRQRLRRGPFQVAQDSMRPSGSPGVQFPLSAKLPIRPTCDVMLSHELGDGRPRNAEDGGCVGDGEVEDGRAFFNGEVAGLRVWLRRVGLRRLHRGGRVETKAKAKVGEAGGREGRSCGWPWGS